MSEPVGPEGAASNPAPDTSTAAMRAGQMLRQAREATGLHVAALAVSLKVPVKKLEALEAGRLDLLPDMTFARALAASVCRTLKIDPTDILEHLPPTGASRLGAEQPSINTPFRPPASSSGPSLSPRGRMPSPAVAAVAALLVAAVAVVLWPKSPSTPEQANVLAPGAEATGTPVPEAAVPAADASSSAPSESIVAAAPVAPAVPATTSVASAPTVPASAAAAAASAPVVITAKAESWIKVTDAKGVVSLGRIVTAGEVVGVNGSLPMALVVGRADAVDLKVNGQPFDLTPFTKDHVARFQVK